MPKTRSANAMLPSFQPSVTDVVILRTIRQLRMLQFPGKWQYDLWAEVKTTVAS